MTNYFDYATVADNAPVELLEQMYATINLYLENYTNNHSYAPTQGDGVKMAKKINRTVKIGGKQVWIHANTEQEYADKIIETAALGALDGATKQQYKFSEYAMNWFNIYSKPHIESVTSCTYQRQLEKYLIPHFGERLIEQISTDDIQRLFNDMSGKRKSTKQKVKAVLNMILDSSVEDGLITTNPLKSKRIRITGEASKTTQEYSVAEMQYLVSRLGSIKSPMDCTYLALQALHPLRLEEVLGLKWADVDTEKMVLHIRRAVTHPKRNLPEIKDTKTAASVRDLALAKTAIPYLHPSSPNDFVFGGSKPLSYSQVRHMCGRIQKDTEFQGKITPMRFRTTVLTDIYDKTHDIKKTQAAAGHTTAAMTLKHYVKGRGNGVDSAAVIDSTYGAAG